MWIRHNSPNFVTIQWQDFTKALGHGSGSTNLKDDEKNRSYGINVEFVTEQLMIDSTPD
jgi:hypothetical protein